MMANYLPKGTVSERKPINSKEKKNADKDTDLYKLYDIDPDTGKKIVRRLDYEAIRREVAAASGTNTSAGRQQSQMPVNLVGKRKSPMELERDFSSCFDVDPITGKKFLRPLNMKTLSYFSSDDSEKPSKLRKIEPQPRTLRKGLFATDELSKAIKTRNSVTLKIGPKKIEPKSITPKSSPLINMEEVEREFVNKRGLMSSYSFKSPTNVTTGLTNSRSKSKNLEVPQIIFEEEEKEPKTPNSTAEFNKFELMFLENNGYTESPITEISNLMQGTEINSKQTKLNFVSNPDSKTFVNDIKQLIKDEEIRHNASMLEEETRHNATMLRLNNLLTNFMKLSEANTNKENTPLRSIRRSTRLQKKSPLVQNIGKLLTSPGISSSIDLRKNTLKKNLAAESLEYNSPKLKNTMETYNLLKKTLLPETPRTERIILPDTPNSRIVSMKIKQQFLALQDTPIHK